MQRSRASQLQMEDPCSPPHLCEAMLLKHLPYQLQIHEVSFASNLMVIVWALYFSVFETLIPRQAATC